MASGGERSVAQVPKAVVIGLAFLAAAQVALRLGDRSHASDASDLPAAPSASAVRLFSLGDPVPAAKLLMLYLQSFDYQSGTRLPFQALDYSRLEQWLGLVLALDPRGQYPLMAASRVYADVPQADKQRSMLDFVYREFFADPDRRWPWLAHAAAVAKHRLNDMERARLYAHAIQEHARGDAVPLWAKQMEAFILEDMSELETARIMIGGFIASGQVKHPGELRFLEQRLKEIEKRIEGTR
jgi:hypothetical protein